VADVLDLTVDEVLLVFKNHPNLRRSLETLADGLGHIALGQSSPSLCGGEAQPQACSQAHAANAPGRIFYLLRP
jgi:excinuclease UvrABC ATPase subunit